MYKLIVLFAIPFLLISCALKESELPKAHKNAKAFEEEDAYILFGLRAEQISEHRGASDIFQKLYEKSGKKEYLYRSLENDLLAKDAQKLIERVDALRVESEDDPKLIRLKIIALLELNRLDEAIELGVPLAATTKKEDDYLLVSEIYTKRQEYDLAVRYLESAYAKEHSEKILDKMSIILYVNLNKKKEAIAQLETHSRVLGCSQLICNRLIAFYSNDNNIDGLLSTYLRLYEVDKSSRVSQKIIQIYTYQRDYKALQKFLEKSNADDATLLQLYAANEEYTKAYKLATRLYEESADVKYLGQSAIYEYENAKGKHSQEVLSSVVEKLERVVKISKEPIYLNYLGYILIDHDLDVKKGMRYIDRVLKIQPDSAYYLDSKAWGYYKLGECTKAKRLIDRVVTLEGGDDPEVASHLKAINSCKKTKKGKK